MARYKLNMGKHSDSGVTYQRGQVITTDKDLTKLNALHGVPKFELLPDENTDPALVAAAASRSGQPVEGARAQRDAGATTAAPGGQVSSGFQVTSGPEEGEKVTTPATTPLAAPTQTPNRDSARDSAQGNRPPKR